MRPLVRPLDIRQGGTHETQAVWMTGTDVVNRLTGPEDTER
ncbi:hypothetical protein ABTY00_36845 [Streptomyces microflavus]